MIVFKWQNVVSVSTVFPLARPKHPGLHRQNLGHSIDYQLTLAEVIIVFEILLEYINLGVDVGVFSILRNHCRGNIRMQIRQHFDATLSNHGGDSRI